MIRSFQASQCPQFAKRNVHLLLWFAFFSGGLTGEHQRKTEACECWKKRAKVNSKAYIFQNASLHANMYAYVLLFASESDWCLLNFEQCDPVCWKWNLGNFSSGKSGFFCLPPNINERSLGSLKLRLKSANFDSNPSEKYWKRKELSAKRTTEVSSAQNFS
jgi:hypothetical protein